MAYQFSYTGGYIREIAFLLSEYSFLKYNRKY